MKNGQQTNYSAYSIILFLESSKGELVCVIECLMYEGSWTIINHKYKYQTKSDV